MKEVYPDYYTDFKCIASKCRHSCCEHWEIDIDEDSYKKYLSFDGKIGEKIKSVIHTEDNVHSFILDKDERCPFLQKDGLCELILQKGENSICKICKEHPRFHNSYLDITETGIGLCCEEAARIIITNKDTVQYIGMDSTHSSDEHISDALDFRKEIFDILHNKESDYFMKFSQIYSLLGCSFENFDMNYWVDKYLSLEILDDNWVAILTNLKNNAQLLGSMDYIHSIQSLDFCFTNIFEYFFYRYYPEIIMGSDPFVVLNFCMLSTEIIRSLCILKNAQTGLLSVSDIIEYARMYSSEIEYSDSNIYDICALMD